MPAPDTTLLEQKIQEALRKSASASEEERQTRLLHGGGGGPTIEGMDGLGLHTRLARLEGGNLVLLAASSVVAAVFLGLSAATLYVALDTRSELRSEVSGLRSDVQALPDQINRNLLELNRTLATAITAAREPATVAPVIVLPGADGAYQAMQPKQQSPVPEKSPAPAQ